MLLCTVRRSGFSEITFCSMSCALCFVCLPSTMGIHFFSQTPSTSLPLLAVKAGSRSYHRHQAENHFSGQTKYQLPHQSHRCSGQTNFNLIVTRLLDFEYFEESFEDSLLFPADGSHRICCRDNPSCRCLNFMLQNSLFQEFHL